MEDPIYLLYDRLVEEQDILVLAVSRRERALHLRYSICYRYLNYIKGGMDDNSSIFIEGLLSSPDEDNLEMAVQILSKYEI